MVGYLTSGGCSLIVMEGQPVGVGVLTSQPSGQWEKVFCSLTAGTVLRLTDGLVVSLLDTELSNRLNFLFKSNCRVQAR